MFSTKKNRRTNFRVTHEDEAIHVLKSATDALEDRGVQAFGGSCFKGAQFRQDLFDELDPQ